MANEKIKPGTRKTIEGRRHIWNGRRWIEEMGFWKPRLTKTEKGQDYILSDGKWTKSYGYNPSGFGKRHQIVDKKTTPKKKTPTPVKKKETPVVKKKETPVVKKKATPPPKKKATPPPKKKATPPPKESLKIKQKSEKEKWLHKTRNSPAAKAFTPEERWAIRNKSPKRQQRRVSRSPLVQKAYNRKRNRRLKS